MPFYGILRYCKKWLMKIVKPIYFGSKCSIVTCHTIAMVNKNTSMCNIIRGTKTPIMYLIGVFVALTKYHMEVFYGCMQMMLKGIP